jgi:hypothetical protein
MILSFLVNKNKKRGRGIWRENPGRGAGEGGRGGGPGRGAGEGGRGGGPWRGQEITRTSSAFKNNWSEWDSVLLGHCHCFKLILYFCRTVEAS